MYIILGVIVRSRFILSLFTTGSSAPQIAEEAWSGIDVQLKRRADLIPNLIETVKAYASHESGTLEGVVELRNRRRPTPR